MSGRPGWFRRKMKRALFGRADWRPCCFCRRQLSFKVATLEHIVPLSLGGGWELSNLAISCSPCNRDRGVQPFEEFRAAKAAALAAPAPAPALAAGGAPDPDLHTTSLATAQPLEAAPKPRGFQQDDRLVEALRGRE